MDDDISCPKCKTSKYRNKSLRLMVNSCGHGLCENCVEQLFSKGGNDCPECGIKLRKANFRMQVFTDSYVEKEVEIRRRMMKDFNRLEEDFPTLRLYNDYLEMVEKYIFNLANNVDVEETNRTIALYKKENAEIIAKNRAKKSADSLMLMDLIEEEKEVAELRKKHGIMSHLKEQQLLQQNERRMKDKMLDEIAISSQSASQIVAIHTRRIKEEKEDGQTKLMQVEESFNKLLQDTKKKSKFSTGIQSQTGQPIGVTVVEGVKYEFEEEVAEIVGPKCPVLNDLKSKRYLDHIRQPEPYQTAGGFQPQFPCLRILQEALGGLYHVP